MSQVEIARASGLLFKHFYQNVMDALKCLIRALPLFLFLMADAVQASEAVYFHFYPIGTPEFLGVSRVGDAAFVAPIADRIATPPFMSCLKAFEIREYEFLLDSSGKVHTLTALHSSQREQRCARKYWFPLIQRWRFRPAMWEGRPTPVIMWLGISRLPIH